MLEAVLHSAEAVLVLFSIAFVGFETSRRGWYTEDSRRLMARLVNLCLPLFLFYNVTSKFTHEDLISVLQVAGLPFLTVGFNWIVSVAIVKMGWVRKEIAGAFIACFTGATVTFLGIPVISIMFGEAAIGYLLVYFFANVIFIWTIGLYGIQLDGVHRAGRAQPRLFSMRSIKMFFQPPLQGFLLGVLFVVLALPVPDPIAMITRDLGRVTSPLALVFIGWLNIYASTYSEEAAGIFSLASRSGNQLVWIGVAAVAAVLVLFLSTRFYKTIAWPLYILSLVLLAAVLVFGHEVNGSKSWLSLPGGFAVQPSEFSKTATALCLSRVMGSYGFKLSRTADFFKVAAILIVPVGLIALEPDVGTILVYCSLAFMLYREGLPGKFLGYVGFAILLFLVTLKFSPSVSILTAIGAVGLLRTLASRMPIFGSSVITGEDARGGSRKYALPAQMKNSHPAYCAWRTRKS